MSNFVHIPVEQQTVAEARQNCNTCYGRGAVTYLVTIRNVVGVQRVEAKCPCVVGRENRAALREMHRKNKTFPSHRLLPPFMAPREAVSR